MRNGKKKVTDPFPPYIAPPELPNLVVIVYGDWSGDGHDHTSRTYVWSNKGVAEWRAAVAKGNAIVGFNIQEDVAAEYEQTAVPKELVEKAFAAGWRYKFDKYATSQLKKDGLYDFDNGSYEDLFLFIVGLGDPELKWQALNHGSHHQEVHAGGYGLFGS